MTDQSSSKKELKFPVVCHYRIITLDIPEINLIIEKALQRLGIGSRLKKENRSKEGKYVSFSVGIKVDSREMMNCINTELNNIEGVKMIL